MICMQLRCPQPLNLRWAVCKVPILCNAILQQVSVYTSSARSIWASYKVAVPNPTCLFPFVPCNLVTPFAQRVCLLLECILAGHLCRLGIPCPSDSNVTAAARHLTNSQECFHARRTCWSISSLAAPENLHTTGGTLMRRPSCKSYKQTLFPHSMQLGLHY